jgi:hypothetical protein
MVSFDLIYLPDFLKAGFLTASLLISKTIQIMHPSQKPTRTLLPTLARCESAWNKDPRYGVIGVQKGPL